MTKQWKERINKTSEVKKLVKLIEKKKIVAGLHYDSPLFQPWSGGCNTIMLIDEVDSFIEVNSEDLTRPLSRNHRMKMKMATHFSKFHHVKPTQEQPLGVMRIDSIFVLLAFMKVGHVEDCCYLKNTGINTELLFDELYELAGL